MMKRKAVCLFLSLVMTVSLLTPSTLATGSGKNVYQNGTFTAEKLSNPTTGEGEADGLVPGGDRLNSYAWSMSRLTDEYGDYVYIGSNRNLMYFGVLQYADSLDNKALLTDILTNGEVPTDCTNYDVTRPYVPATT